MTDHEIQLLTVGIAVGMYVMLLLQITYDILDNRRDRKAARAAKEQLKAAQERAAA
ncbi:hypothetical protein AB0L99_42685 [Streptomyces sp. NPDC051954]|uniref:hypothetical protein n=1 Tax=Streptomyces sp. NPDC051954 TaxID=3155524 RepID=UPI003442EF26